MTKLILTSKEYINLIPFCVKWSDYAHSQYGESDICAFRKRNLDKFGITYVRKIVNPGLIKLSESLGQNYCEITFVSEEDKTKFIMEYL